MHVLLAAVLWLTGCSTPQQRSQAFRAAERQQQIGPARITPAELQSEIMTFTDMYSELISQATDEAFFGPAATPETRSLLLRLKLQVIQGAIRIASGANPVVALLDMTVMVSMQRHAWETYWMPELSDEEAERAIQSVLRQLEERIWEITAMALDDQQQGALHELIRQLIEEHAGQKYVSNIRASEFAEERRQTFIKVKGGGSLLGLFALDPLAKLSPATRELIEARLLGERVFYYAQRLPTLVQWHTQEAMVNTLLLPEVQQVLRNLDGTMEVATRAVKVAEGFSEGLAKEREAAIEQFFERLAVEREAFFGRLESDEARLRGVLGDLRVVIESGGELSESLQVTFVEATELANALAVLKQPVPGGRPLDITELQRATEAATETVRELNIALASAGELLSGEAWGERDTQIRQAATESRRGLEALIDRLFWRGLVLAAAVGAILLVVLAANRFIATRIRPAADQEGTTKLK